MNYGMRNRKVAIARWQNRDAAVNAHLVRTNGQQRYLTYKARLLGFITGDGSISIHAERDGRLHHTIGFFPDHESLVRPYQEAFEALYLAVPRAKNLGKYFCVKISCRPAACDLLRYGSLTSTQWQAPLELLKTRELKAEWLRAYFDCEAYVGERVIQVQSVSEKGLTMIVALLAEMGIKAGLCSYRRKQATWNVNYILSICSCASRTAFLYKIGFNHEGKQQRLIASLKKREMI